MQPPILLDQATTPDGRKLALSRRGEEFRIEVDGMELMSSRAHGSEDSLARLALEALGSRARPRALVGGLGMGFTTRALLDGLAIRPGASVVIAEVFPAVVAWNRRWLGHLAGQPLTDARVQVIESDFADFLASGPKPFDVILLDVDNGPEAFTLDGNARLYTRQGLERLRQALTPGGVLAVWSGFEHPPFANRLRQAGFAVKVRQVRARSEGKGGRHIIFVGRRP